MLLVQLESLKDVLTIHSDPATLKSVAIAMSVSLVAAWIAKFAYEFFYEGSGTGSQLQRSFLLVGPSITLLFIAVQLSLPLSLGLLGALSIVRFRVPIKDPEEIGFLMVVIASSIACATFAYGLLVILFGLCLGVLVIREFAGGFMRLGWKYQGSLVLTLQDQRYMDSSEKLDAVLRSRVRRVHMEYVTSQDGITTLCYNLKNRAPVAWGPLRSEIEASCSPDGVVLTLSRGSSAET